MTSLLRRFLHLIPAALFLTVPALALAQPVFTGSFSPDTIGPGSETTLTFTIGNSGSASPAESLAFTGTLPAAVTIAAGSTSDSCGGSLTAAQGGSSISYSGGSLGGGASCAISVPVTASTAGTHSFTSGDLTSSLGNSGSAADDLTVSASIPGFSKSASPAALAPGSIFTLTYTADNTANGGFTQFSFSETLPAGLELATPPNAATSCSGAVTAAGGGSSISLGSSLLNAGSSCTVSVDVKAVSPGSYALTNTLNVFFPSSATSNATASVTVTAPPADGIGLTKAFGVSQASGGDTVTLNFTLQNTSRDNGASGIGFSDDLDAFLTGTTFASLTSNSCGGSLSGSSTLSYSGGSLAGGASCAVSVDVNLPAGAAAATYTNTTSAITAADFGGSPYTGSAAATTLRILADGGLPVSIAKAFTGDPVQPGETVTARYTLTNPNSAQAASAIAFSDALDTPGGIAVSSGTGPDLCGSGSFVTLTSSGGTDYLSLSGGNLAAGASCTFDVVYSIAAGTAPGDYATATSAVSATVGGASVSSSAGASATLSVEGGANLSLVKEFAATSAQAGTATGLSFTITSGPESANTATAIAFTDDLDAFLSGTTLSAVTSNSCGGSVGGTGTSSLSYSGGSLDPDQSCTIAVEISLPAGASGSYTNTTSTLTASAGGQATSAAAASAALLVLEAQPLVTAKSFSPASALPGETVTLSYTLQNPDSSLAYSSLFFTDSYSAALSGLAATGPAAFGGGCTGSPGFSGTTLGIFTGIEIAPGATCTITLGLLVPAAAADGTYGSASSSLSAQVNGNAVTLPAIAASLTVSTSDLLELSKSYLTNPVPAGGAVDVQYTITNQSSSHAVTALAFSDSLESGMVVAATPNAATSCTGGTLSAAAGAGIISYSGGSLAAGASCTVSVSLTAPSSAGSYSGATGTVTGTANGAAVSGGTASATLTVQSANPPSLSKSFAPSALAAGGSATLSYTISNPAGGSALSGLRFTDDLDAALSGLAVTGGTGSNLCGSGSAVSGSSTVVLSGGSLAPGESCTIALTVTVPAGAATGSYAGSTSSLTDNGSFAANGAAAGFSVEPAPGFAKAFGTASIAQGDVTSLTFTIDNSASAIAAAALAFTDSLPAGMAVADPANATASCAGGTITATPGAGTVSYSGGSVAAGASCTVSADVRATATGTLSNTSGDLTSSSGNSGPASASLTVTAAPVPGFAKSFAGPSAGLGSASTMTLTIDNSAALIEASALDFTDSLPAGMVVADPANAATTCTGGTLTAAAGGSAVSYSGGTVAAASSCTITADITPVSAGTLVNTTGDLTSSLGNSGPASASLNVPMLTLAAPIAADDVINGSEAPAIALSGTAALIGDGRIVTVTATDGAAGSTAATAAVAGNAWSLSLDVSGLADGSLTFTAAATDTAGAAAEASAMATKDATAPAGYSVGFDQAAVNAANETAISFSFAAAEIGATYAYTVSSGGGGADVTGSGTIASAADQITGLDLSGLGSGTLTLSAVLTDTAGNAGAAATDTVEKDTAAPSIGFDSPLAGDDTVNAAEAAAAAISGITGDIADGATVTVTATDAASATASGTATVAGNAWSLTLDLSSLADGSLSLTADALDGAGNPAPQASATLAKDTVVPSGYSAAFDRDPLNAADAASASFSFAGAEIGASYAYTIGSDGGGSDVTGTGTIATATDQVAGLDLSGLGDGTLTLTVTLSDAAGNAGTAAAGTATKDAEAPSLAFAGPDSAQSDPFEVTVTFSESVTGFSLDALDITNGSASDLTGSGADYRFTLTPEHDGSITLAAAAGAASDDGGNPSAAAGPAEFTAALTGTPDPSPPADADGDGIPDALESATADRDGDGIPDAEDYDPQGYFYCEDDGRILTGGSLTVTGPSGSNSSLGIRNDINILRDGSTGEYQWFALRPGTYTVSYGYPADGVASTARTSAGSLDVTSLLPANPAVLGSTQVGATGFLADASLGANPVFYDTFVIEAGDPNVLANNVPMTQCAGNEVVLSAASDGAEANGGATAPAEFTVSQARASTLDTVVSYTLAGSATEGDDYAALAGSVTIPAGDTSAVITVTVLEDSLIEGSETIALTLTAVTAGDAVTVLSATAADLTGSAAITDDDFALVAVSNDDLTASENGEDTAAMSFSLMGQPANDVVLAFAGDDQCTVSPAAMTFTAGNFTAAQTLTIRAIDDTLVEGSHSCQPTVAVSSADTRFDGAAVALAQVQIEDDLVDQIRDRLTQVLKEDLETTVKTQQRFFSRMSKGALDRLKAGTADLPCGTVAAFDVDGSVQAEGGTGASEGSFGWDVYNCGADSREILDGSFSLHHSDTLGTQALLQFARQSEQFRSEDDLRGTFWGGYLSRTNVQGLADGTIKGFGFNTGIYGARTLGTGLFLDYYAAAAAGRHSYRLDFATATSPIRASGDYAYAAGFAGAALSGRRDYGSLVLSPRIGVDLAYAAAGDSGVTATQLSQTDTGTIEIPDYNGGRIFAELEFSGLGTPEGSARVGEMITRMSVAPRLACEASSFDSGLGCGVGLAFARQVFDPASGLSFGFEIDYEHLGGSDRLALDVTRERPFANGRGAVVTRLTLPSEDAMQIEHGLRLDF